MLDFSDLFGSLAGRALILIDILFYSSGWLALDQGPVAFFFQMRLCSAVYELVSAVAPPHTVVCMQGRILRESTGASRGWPATKQSEGSLTLEKRGRGRTEGLQARLADHFRQLSG